MEQPFGPLNDLDTSHARIKAVIHLRRKYIHWTHTRIAQEVGLTKQYIGIILSKAGLVTAEDVMRTLPVHSVKYTHISPSKMK